MNSLDKVDRSLILELQKNGRETNLSLAKKLEVSEGTIRKRLKRLLNEKAMKIVAVPNLRKIGYGFTSIMGLQVNIADLRKVTDNLARNKHVCYLAFGTGRYDLTAVIVTSSPEGLSQFIEKEISAIPGILRTETFVNLDIIKGRWGTLDTIELTSATI